ncbi:MAG: DUF3971 domain-containing protein, partial [Aquisalimonadaceae bacterium]
MSVQHPRSSTLRRLPRLLWYILTITLVLMAVGLTALRIAVAVIPEYRAQVEARISESLGQPLTLGGLHVKWRGSNPQVVLENVEVGAGGGAGSGLAFQELRVNVDLLSSLRARELTPSGIELVGMDLTVQRDIAGKFRVVGVGAVGLRDSALEATSDFLDELTHRRLDLNLTDSRVRLLDLRRQHTRKLHKVELLMRAIPGGGQRLSGRAELPGRWGRELAFALEWERDRPPSRRLDRAQLFIEARGLRPETLDELVGDAVGPGLPVSVEGNLRLWGQLRGDLQGLLMGEPGAAGSQSGYFTLRGGQGALNLPGLFRDPIPFEHLAAEAHWRLDSEGWRLDVDESVMDNSDGRVVSRFTLARRQQEPLFVDLRANLRGEPGNAARIYRYLPAGIMRDGLLAWLDRGIEAGTVGSADVIFFGHAPDFPFQNGRGHFEVRADATDATLNYLPEWPALTGLRAHLHFQGRSMRITADGGDIGGARLLRAEAVIPELGRTPLAITGRMQAAGASMLGFLRDVPLTGPALDQTLSTMHLDGDHGLSLALEIPFGGRPVDVDGRIELNEAGFRVPAWDLSLESINGAVSFDRSGVTASGVLGRFRGAPLVLSAENREVGNGGRLIRLRADARQVPLSTLHEHVPGTEFLTGAGNLSVIADLPGFGGDTPSDFPVELQFNSDLIGVSNAMPAPFGKAPGDDLALSVRFGVGGRFSPFRIQYGDRASIVLTLAEQGGGIERMGVRLGGTDATLPSQRGIALTGRTTELDLGGWLAWSPQPETGVRAEQTPLALRSLDIGVDSLRLGGLNLPDIAVRGQRDDGWDLLVDGPTAAGTLHLPEERDDNDDPLRVDLRYLRLASLPVTDTDEGGGRSRGGRSGNSMKPSGLPTIDVDISNLVLMGRDMGRLRLQGSREVTGDYRLREFTLNGPDHAMEANGRWRVPEGSDFRFSLRSEDVGMLLSAWGHPDAMRGGRGRFHGSLAWPGGPMDIEPAAVDGQVRLDVSNGRLLQVEPGAGRLLGLVSVAMLPRRLFLNFSDVFDEGFVFDTLVADIDLADGRAEPQRLFIDGPSARISAAGEVDLVARNYDQIVTVVPKASATLPLIGGLIGGPPAAAALFVAQQLFSQGVDGIARVQYRLTGPW